MSNFDDLFSFSIMNEEETEMLNKFKKVMGKKVRRKFKRLVDVLKQSDKEIFLNLLDMLAHPEKRTEIEGGITNFDVMMYCHPTGNIPIHDHFTVDNIYYNWMKFATDELEMDDAEAEDNYYAFLAEIDGWLNLYIESLGKEFGVEVKEAFIGGWDVRYQGKNNIRFGTMAEAKE